MSKIAGSLVGLPSRVLVVRLVWHYRPSKVAPRVPPNSSFKADGYAAA
jgi:hypothetical protein